MCTRSTPRSGSVTRVIVSSSTGGKAPRKTPAGPKRKKRSSSASSSTSGSSAFTHVRAPARPDIGVSATVLALHDEHSCPPELGELALMSVEKERPLVVVGELEDRPLALTQHHVVGELVMREIRAGPEQLVEVRVQVERVDRIEF